MGYLKKRLEINWQEDNVRKSPTIIYRERKNFRYTLTSEAVAELFAKVSKKINFAS